MECWIAGCPRHYEAQSVLYLEYHRGEPVVAADVPANVCDICGDTLFTSDTTKQLDRLHQHLPRPRRLIPLYTFTDAAAEIDQDVAIEAVVAAR